MPITTQVSLRPAAGHPLQGHAFQQLDVIANDRPGLLASMAQIFLKYGVELHNAKINTLGNRVEDSFLISACDGQPLGDTQSAALSEALNGL